MEGEGCWEMWEAVPETGKQAKPRATDLGTAGNAWVSPTGTQ